MRVSLCILLLTGVSGPHFPRARLVDSRENNSQLRELNFDILDLSICTNAKQSSPVMSTTLSATHSGPVLIHAFAKSVTLGRSILPSFFSFPQNQSRLVPVPSQQVATEQVEFTLFPKLAPELRLKIWGETVIPRLVGWGPGNSVPATFLVNTEAREETMKQYTLITLPHLRNKTYNLYISFDKDLLFRNMNLPRATQFMNPLPGQLPITPSLANPIKRLAINLDEAHYLVNAFMIPITFSMNWPTYLRHVVLSLCPNLEELVVILKPNPTAGCPLEDLVDIEGYVKVTARQVDMINRIQQFFKLDEARQGCSPMKIRFMWTKREKYMLEPVRRERAETA